MNLETGYNVSMEQNTLLMNTPLYISLLLSWFLIICDCQAFLTCLQLLSALIERTHFGFRRPARYVYHAPPDLACKSYRSFNGRVMGDVKLILCIAAVKHSHSLQHVDPHHIMYYHILCFSNY